MVIDASIWVSALVPSDVHHQASHHWLNENLATGEAVFAPTLLLAEVGGAVARRTGIPAIGEQAIEQILRTPGLQLVALDLTSGADAARLTARLRLRGADAIYVTVAHLLQVPLVTWDQELLVRATGYVQVISP